MKEVSDFLGNTPTLARSSYVDPRRRHETTDARQAALERATLRLIKGA